VKLDVPIQYYKEALVSTRETLYTR